MEHRRRDGRTAEAAFHVEHPHCGHPRPDRGHEDAGRLQDDLRRMEDLAESTGVGLESDQIHKLRNYAEIVHRWGSKTNLVSPGDLAFLGTRHILPALHMGVALSSIRSSTILDLGSGAGLPGVPVKILLRDPRVVLVESRRRRANFLREAVRSLELMGAEVANARIEECPPSIAGSDVIVSRAVAAPLELLRWAARFLAPHGALVTTLAPMNRSSLRLPVPHVQVHRDWPGGSTTIVLLWPTAVDAFPQDAT